MESIKEKVAIVGKFSQRNNAHELGVEKIFGEVCPGLDMAVGHRVSGRLNFPRRAATTILTLATKDRFRDFAGEMEQSLRQRNIKAPIFLLKADGGTLLLERSIETPVETIFSGPAASTMGVVALAPKGHTAVVVDIGGTTTDLALILNGRPLLSKPGYVTQRRIRQPYCAPNAKATTGAWEQGIPSAPI